MALETRFYPVVDYRQDHGVMQLDGEALDTPAHEGTFRVDKAELVAGLALANGWGANFVVYAATYSTPEEALRVAIMQTNDEVERLKAKLERTKANLNTLQVALSAVAPSNK